MAKSKIEELSKDREKLAGAIQNDVTALAMKLSKFTDLSLEIYKGLSNPDALFNDCPISNMLTYHYLKEWMVKKDMDFIGLFIPDGKVSVVPFQERAVQATKWVVRFAKEPVKEKTGLEAIL